MKLTAIQIRQAKPKTKAYKLFDGQGLFLQVNPNGNKWWRLKYRYQGKEKLISLGTYPNTSLKDARAKVIQMKQQLSDGLDPSQQREEAKRQRKLVIENSFEEIAIEWYNKFKTGWSESHSNY